MMIERLPVSNPQCAHAWVFDPRRLVWCCEACSYEVTEAVLSNQHRDDPDLGFSTEPSFEEEPRR